MREYVPAKPARVDHGPAVAARRQAGVPDLRRTLGNALVQRCGGMPEPCPCHEDGASVHRHADGPSAPATGVPPIVSEVVAGPGFPLPADLRLSMGQAFQVSGVAAGIAPVRPPGAGGLAVSQPGDASEREAAAVAARVASTPDGQLAGRQQLARPEFEDVRIHTDTRAAEAARSISASAYTVGNHIVFGGGAFAPHTSRGRALIAHELTHVVQQGGSGSAVQRDACPPRPAGEAAKSRDKDGVLAFDVIFNAATNQLDIMDFAVDSHALPAGAVDSPGWQRAMSLIAGDPSIRVAVEGFTDCAGSHAENLSLRKERTAAVIAAMPPAASAKILFSFTTGTTTFLDTNATAAGRARNRSVRVTFSPAPPKGTDPCDTVQVARSMDEYLFLVRCLERRLGLTSAADAPKALSVLRQLYYGSAPWSASRNRAWDWVVTGRPWSPGLDPTPALHPPLAAALRRSQVVDKIDIGHVLTGLDAMLAPADVVIPAGRLGGLQTALPNEEWATWAGDVGSAAAEWAWDAWMSAKPNPAAFGTFFARYASDSDLLGDIDSFAVRAGLGTAAPAAQLMRGIRLTGPLSELLLQYFRISGSALGAAHGGSVANFVAAYGGVVAHRTLTNPTALAARLRPSVDEFARLFSMQRLLMGSSGQQPPAGAPPFPVVLAAGIDEMTARFVDWLAHRL